MDLPMEQLRIIAQPKAFYRDRYESEIDKSKNRAQRYILAEDNYHKHEYPTIELPKLSYNVSNRVYIRVASVTVCNNDVATVCVHPYPIDTDDDEVLKDPDNNALYFPVTKEDLINGRKSFRFTRKKLTQNELELHGPLRIFDSDDRHMIHLTGRPHSKQLIKIYKLMQSQLVFTRAERIDDNDFHLFPDTSISSQVMSGAMLRPHGKAISNPVVPTKSYDRASIICEPKQGNCTGGDSVLMVINKLDRKKALSVYFDYAKSNEKINIQYEFVDTKTIIFQTPPYLMVTSDQNWIVPIVAVQDEKIIGQFSFLYVPPAIASTMNIDSHYYSNTSSFIEHSTPKNKRFRRNFDDFFLDFESE